MKKTLFLLFSLLNSNKIIKNINVPSCKNCIHYKPKLLDQDFTSTFNKCEKFGEKDIITDKITYKFADSCRNDETKCGFEGKYFEEEKNIKLKLLKHKIITSIPYIFMIFCFFINIITIIAK
jgi:hypothetical protein